MTRRRVARLVSRCALFFLTASSFVSLARLAHAEPLAELVARMDALRLSVSEEQAAADLAEQRRKELERLIKGIKSDVDKLKKEERAMAANLAELEKSQSAADTERIRLIEQQTSIKQRLIERIKAVYLVPKTSVVAYLMNNNNSAASLGLVNRYLEAVYDHDTGLATQLRGVATKIAAHSSSVRGLLAKQKTLSASLRQRREAVAEKLTAQERAVLLAKTEQVDRERAVATLRAKLLRFETTLTGLTGGSYEVVEGETSSVERVDESFEGPGLFANLTGGSAAAAKKTRSLAAPVSGKIITRFGGSRRDGQPSKGLEIAASKLSAVRAIADGRVVFAGELPGLGSVVVIDHGQRSFTLYGRLAAIKCAVGAAIAALDPVGEADGTAPFYFEVRQAGVPVDPRSIIAIS